MEGSFPIDEEVRRLFYSLLARAQAGKFDEAFLLSTKIGRASCRERV